MKLRRTFFNNTNELNIEKSIFDFTWIEDINEKENVLFIAEGLLFYLTNTEVKLIFNQIGANFKNSFIAFDTVPKKSLKTKKHESVKVNEAPSKWGNHQLNEIEAWDFGFKSKKIYPILYRHFLRWRGLGFLTIFPNFRNGFKVGVMSIN